MSQPDLATDFVSGDPDSVVVEESNGHPHLHVVDACPAWKQTEADATRPRAITAATLAEGAGDPSSADNLRAVLVERAFNFAIVPPRPRPIMKMNGQTIWTPGNLNSGQGPVKAGKTALMEAMAAAIFNGNRQGPDTLGFAAENPEGEAVIHLDTEQSRFDHDSLIRRAMRRAMVETPPPWFYSYCFTDLTIADRLAALECAIEDASLLHGGVFAVMIDGIADLCADPNDPKEAFALVGGLHATAIKHDCSIFVVIHENPGSENGKTRGHLGSQIERKAETPLRLAKDATSGVTTVWSDRARHRHIPREQGMCFAWSNEAGMHISAGTAREIKASAKQAKFFEEAKAAFGPNASLSYSELAARIKEIAGVTIKTAEKHIVTYQVEGVALKNQEGKYLLKVPLPSNPPATLIQPSRG